MDISKVSKKCKLQRHARMHGHALAPFGAVCCAVSFSFFICSWLHAEADAAQDPCLEEVHFEDGECNDLPRKVWLLLSSSPWEVGHGLDRQGDKRCDVYCNPGNFSNLINLVN